MSGRPPRHDGGATGPASARSRGSASAWEIGQDRNRGERGGVVEIEALGRVRRPDVRGQGIAGEERHVGHRTALDTAVHAVGAGGIDVALHIAVVPRVGVDQAADGAALGRDLRFDAAPGAAVAREDDLAGDVDAAARKLIVVVRHPVVDVYQLAGHVTVDRVRVVARKLLVDLPGRAVLGQHGLRQRRGVAGRRRHLQAAQARRREEHLEGLDLRVIPPGPEPLGDELGHLLPEGRPDMMGPRAEVPQPVAQVFGAERGVEARLERPLRGRPLADEARHRFLGRCPRGLERQDQQTEADAAGPHSCTSSHVASRCPSIGLRMIMAGSRPPARRPRNASGCRAAQDTGRERYRRYVPRCGLRARSQASRGRAGPTARTARRCRTTRRRTSSRRGT